MISTRNLLTFYWYYAQWSLRGFEVAWLYRKGWYFVTSKKTAAKWL